jgi:intracellular septation protein
MTEPKKLPEDAARDIPPGEAEGSPLKLALDLGPLLAFFATYAVFGLIPATAVIIVGTVASLIASRILIGKLSPLPVVSGILVVVFGGLTVWLQDEQFIKLKPTIVNLLFSGILLGGLAFGHALLQPLFGAVFQLTAEGWRKLTLRWGCFFLALAALNEVIWRNFSTSAWVSFKTFGTIILTMIFLVAQKGLLQAHAIEPDKRER